MMKINSKYLHIYSKLSGKFFAVIEKIVPDELIGKKEIIHRGYKNIYGNESIENRVRSYSAINLKRLIILFLGVFLIIIAFLFTEINENNYIVKNEANEIIAIKVPIGEEIAIPMELGIVIEGEEKTEAIIFSSPREKSESFEGKEEIIIEDLQENSSEKYKKAQRETRIYLNELKESNPKELYYLPNKSEDGDTIYWYLKKSRDELLVLLLFPLLLIFIYRSRYRKLKEEESRTKKVVKIELSEFITKLLLLLDAGLVMSAAFQKIIKDYECSIREEGLALNYFYQQLVQINHTVIETKGNFPRELKEFAYRTKIPEFIRLANIISDNYQMGSDLVDKLILESEMLWFTRKKIAIEQGKLAEIKLTLPLMLLMLSLLIITISPVLLEI